MSWARVSVESGAKVVGEVPVLAIHETASCWEPSVTSLKECRAPGSGRSSMLWIHTAASPRDTGASGLKQCGVKCVIVLLVDHCTAFVYQTPSATSPYLATAPAGDDEGPNNTAVKATTDPTINQTRLNPTNDKEREQDIGNMSAPDATREPEPVMTSIGPQ